MPYYVQVADATAGLSTVCFGDVQLPVVGGEGEAAHVVVEEQADATRTAEIVGVLTTDITEEAPSVPPEAESKSEATSTPPEETPKKDATSEPAPSEPPPPSPPPFPGLGLGQPLKGGVAASSTTKE